MFEMTTFLEGELQAVGAQVKRVPLGKQVLDGQEIDLPPALLASIGNDPKKKTILCYGHYDVQPVRTMSILYREFEMISHFSASGSQGRWMGYRALPTLRQ